MEGGEYIIKGGTEGKTRLDILAGVLQDGTEKLLRANGVAAGTSFLDVGCGGGNISLLAAAIVGSKGRVTGIDLDEKIIALDQQDARAKQVSNISYGVMSAADLLFANEFDVAYSRFLLCHLSDPLPVIKNMLRSVKPGGHIIAEDIQFSGHFCFPPEPAFDEYVALYTAAARHRGQNPEIGPQLASLFHEAGIAEVGFDLVQPAFNKGPGKWMAFSTMNNIKETVLALGLASEDTIAKILQRLEAFTHNEQSIMSLPRIFRVWGRKLGTGSL